MGSASISPALMPSDRSCGMLLAQKFIDLEKIKNLPVYDGVIPKRKRDFKNIPNGIVEIKGPSSKYPGHKMKIKFRIDGRGFVHRRNVKRFLARNLPADL
jgi:hypothetical protein